MKTKGLRDMLARHILEFAKALEQVDIYNDRHFHEALVLAITYYNVEVSALAKEIRITQGTVSKWKHSQSIPHPMVRPVIISVIRALLVRQINDLQDERPGGK